MFDLLLTGQASFFKSVMDRSLAVLLIVPRSHNRARLRLDSKGPVPFRQRRFGFTNEQIEIRKIRSMYVELGDASAAHLLSKGDPGVTRIRTRHPNGVDR